MSVRTEWSRPIPAASISVVGEDGSILASGLTDESGSALLQLSADLSVLDVGVAAEGYATEWLYLECPLPVTLPVTLVPSSTLSGLVFLGDEPASGAAVSAQPESYFQLGREPSARVLRATADAEGRFTIEGARPGIFYTLRAGAPGRLSDPLANVRAPRDDLEIRLKRVFGAVVNLRDPSGKEPRGALLSAALRLDPPAPAGSVPVDAAALGLAGVPVRELCGGGGYEHLFACLSDSADSKLGPVRVSIDAPGYHSAERAVWLHAVEDGSVPSFEMTFEAKADAECVQVRLDNLPGEASEAKMVWPLMVVWLVSKSGAGQIEIPLLDLKSSREACGVPLGEYHVHVTSTYAHYVELADPIVVERGQGATIALDLSGLGAVRLEVEGPEGTPYTGMLTVDIRSEDPYDRSEGTLNFAQAPYFFPLPEGVFSLQLGLPRMLKNAGEYGVQGFAVVRGETTTLALSQ